MVDKIRNAMLLTTPRHRAAANPTPRLPPTVLALINTRRKLKRENIISPSPDKRKHINLLNKSIKSIIKETREQIEHQKAQTIKQGPKHPRFWPLIKNMLNPMGHKTHPIVKNNIYAGEPHDKLALFKDLYEEILIDHTKMEDLDTIGHYVTFRTNLLKFTPPNNTPPHPLLTPVTSDELADALRKTKNNKAPGPDEIRYEHLKFAPISLINILLKIYTYCIEYAYFPEHFKTCHVVLIPKPNKDPKQITSYRPITLAPVLSKMLEKLIAYIKECIVSKQGWWGH